MPRRRLALPLLAAALLASPALAQAPPAPKGADATVAAIPDPALQAFYRSRGNRPVWNPATSAALLAAIEQAKADGLRSSDYDAPVDPGVRHSAWSYDLALSGAFLKLARHLAHGRVDPATLSEGWRPTFRPVAFDSLLAGVASGALTVDDALDRARPPHAAYARLRNALAGYRRFAAEADDLPTILPASKLRLGDRSVRVPLVRQRLRLTGDYHAAEPEDPRVFDPALDAAVRRFQARHGLGADGVVGQRTRTALNRSPEHWVRIIELNLERLRWLPADLGDRRVEVNIPAFRLRGIENGREVLAMNVVTGKMSWMTPVFSDEIERVIFNPTWGVPPSIAADETIPLARRHGAGYLTRKGYAVYSGGQAVDPTTVDWSQATAGRYRFVQGSGPANPLGQVKFEFPNPDDIYIHDTNAKRLFAKDLRAFSHGCIRAEAPDALAEWLLRDRGWTAERARAEMEGSARTTLELKRRVPVHILYLTAEATPDGLRFYPDVYRHDERLAAALGLSHDAEAVAVDPEAETITETGDV